MLVRFNKGPYHRKVRDMPEHEVQRGVVNIAVYDSKYSKVRFFDPNATTQVMVAPGHKIATYRIKMVTVNLRGQPETLPSVYPDGAVCFELEGIY